MFIKNLHISTEPQELKEHLQDCGEILRITIPVDKATTMAKGYYTHFDIFRFAYVEFATREGAMHARRLNESLFKGRQLTVLPKRKNLP